MLSSFHHRLSGLRLPATLSIALLLAASSTALARSRLPRLPGKVLLIRGAFNVFSLGLDELAQKLLSRGLDVEVTSASLSSSAASRIRDAYRANPSKGPIVIIGHSLGAKLAPRLAGEMKRYGVPEKLVVILDAPERTSVPANVERCVNIYQSIPIGIVRGYPARAEGRSTEIINVDIARLQGWNPSLVVNHFNIEATDWIHDAVIEEVVRACTPPSAATPLTKARVGMRSPPSAATLRKKAAAAAKSPSNAGPPGEEAQAAIKIPWQPSHVAPRKTIPRPIRW